jgi:PKD repeat protein
MIKVTFSPGIATSVLGKASLAQNGWGVPINNGTQTSDTSFHITMSSYDPQMNKLTIGFTKPISFVDANVSVAIARDSSTTVFLAKPLNFDFAVNELVISIDSARAATIESWGVTYAALTIGAGLVKDASNKTSLPQNGWPVSMSGQQSHVNPIASFYATPVSGIGPLTVRILDTCKTCGSGTVGAIMIYGDGAIDTLHEYDSVVTHTYTKAGVYTLTYIAIGGTASDTLTRVDYVTVYDIPVADFTATPTNGNGPLTVAFSDKSTGTFSTYAWDFGDGTTSTAASPTHTYGVTGQYTVTLVVSGLGGIDTLTMPEIITVLNSAPVITSADSLKLTEDVKWTYVIPYTDVNNDTVSFTLTAQPVGLSLSGRTLSWQPENKDVGLSSVTFVASDEEGLKDTATIILTVINVNDIPTLDSIILADTTWEDSVVAGYVVASDPDVGDSLRLELDTRLSWMKIGLPTVSTSGMWKFPISGTPLNENTGLTLFTITVKDKIGENAATRDSIFVINGNDPPETKIIAKKIAYGAVRMIASGKDDFDTVLTYYAVLAGAGNDTLKTFASTTVPSFDAFPLMDGNYVFSVYAVDSKGLADLTPAIDTITIVGATAKAIGKAGSWQMVSIPGNNFLADTLKDSSKIYKGKISRWDEGGIKRDIYSYYVPSKEISALTSGNSYWLKTAASANATLASTSISTAAVTVSLSKTEDGWNQISSPYPYPVRYTGTGTIWKWDAATNDYVQLTQPILEPWQGYWVQVPNAQIVTFNPEPEFTTGTLAKLAKTFYNGKSEWQIQFALLADEGRDADNVIGFSKRAIDGIDELDHLEPPRMGDAPNLFIISQDKSGINRRFASDIRNRFDDNINVFEIGIAPAAIPVPSSVNINGISTLQDVYVFIGGPDGVSSVPTDSVLAIAASDKTTYRTVFVSADKNFLTRFPYRFNMHAPYPNPFRPVVNLKYTLPFRWNSEGRLNSNAYAVRIAVYNIQGREVKTLRNDRQGPGQYHVVWDGLTNSGAPLAAGAYFCRITADKNVAVKQMMMVK